MVCEKYVSLKGCQERFLVTLGAFACTRIVYLPLFGPLVASILFSFSNLRHGIQKISGLSAVAGGVVYGVSALVLAL